MTEPITEGAMRSAWAEMASPLGLADPSATGPLDAMVDAAAAWLTAHGEADTSDVREVKAWRKRALTLRLEAVRDAPVPADILANVHAMAERR